MKRAFDPKGRGGARRKRHPHPLTTHIQNLLGFRVRRNPARACRVPFFASAKNRRRFGLGSGPSGCPKARASQKNFLGDGQSFRDSLGGGASLALASVILALGAGPSGFPKQISGRRPKFCDSLPRAAGRASRNKFPSNAKRGDLGRRQPWQTRADARARSVILALGSGPSGFPKQFSGRSFRDSRGKPAPSLAHTALFWCWGAGLTGFPKQVSERCKAGGSWRPPRHKPMSQHGRPSFINQKRRNCQISSFGLRMADVVLSRIRSLSAARPSHF